MRRVRVSMHARLAYRDIVRMIFLQVTASCACSITDVTYRAGVGGWIVHNFVVTRLDIAVPNNRATLLEREHLEQYLKQLRGFIPRINEIYGRTINVLMSTSDVTHYICDNAVEKKTQLDELLTEEAMELNTTK